MISPFPEFSKLDIKHKAEIEAIVNRFPPYSDFNFISLHSWDTDNSTSISLLNENLVIQLPDYITSEPVLSLLGIEQIDESLHKLLATTDKLKLIPEHTVNAIKNPKLFSIEEDRDNHDYIYDLSEIISLSGGKFKKIRNKINAFTSSDLVNVTVKNSFNIDGTEKAEFVLLFDEWAKTAKQSKEESIAERIAITRLIKSASSLKLLFTTARHNSHLVAFSINEIVEDQYAVCHFEKALPVHNNIFSFVAHEGAKALLSQGVKYANWEQDLGIEGLRRSKLSHRPSHYLKKYTIRLKDS